MQLDQVGRILEANSPALEILRSGDGLLHRDGALDARLSADRSRLQKPLAGGLPDWWGEAPGGGSMTVERPSRRSRLALYVMPVGDAEADFEGHQALPGGGQVSPCVWPWGRSFFQCIRLTASRTGALLSVFSRPSAR